MLEVRRQPLVVARRPYLDAMYAGIWLTSQGASIITSCMEQVFNPEMLVPRELTSTCTHTNKWFLSILLFAVSLITLMKILIKMTLYRRSNMNIVHNEAKIALLFSSCTKR